MSYENICLSILDIVNEKFSSKKKDLKTNPRRIRVGHYVTTPQQYFPSLAESFLKRSEQVEYTILYSGFDAEYFHFFTSRNGRLIHAGEESIISSMDFDIFFMQHPYYNIADVEVDFYGIMRRLPEYILSSDFNKQPLLCFIPYAFTVIDEKCHSPVNGFHNLPIHNCAWKVFCETEYHLEKAKQNSINKGANWVVSGYPKIDRIHPVIDSIEKDPEIVLVWAPHHNPSFQGVAIRDVHKFLSELVDSIDYLTIVFRPHPNLLSLSDDGFARLNISKTDFEDISRFWECHRKGRFDMIADLSLLFEDSSLMLTDCGGFQVEYTSTGKPLVSYINSSILNEFAANLINETGYHCHDLDSIKEVVSRLVIERYDEKARFRKESLKVLKPFDSSAEFVVNYICEQLLGK